MCLGLQMMALVLSTHLLSNIYSIYLYRYIIYTYTYIYIYIYFTALFFCSVWFRQKAMSSWMSCIDWTQSSIRHREEGAAVFFPWPVQSCRHCRLSCRVRPRGFGSELNPPLIPSFQRCLVTVVKDCGNVSKTCVNIRSRNKHKFRGEYRKMHLHVLAEENKF